MHLGQGSGGSHDYSERREAAVQKGRGALFEERWLSASPPKTLINDADRMLTVKGVKKEKVMYVWWKVFETRWPLRFLFQFVQSRQNIGDGQIK